MNAENVDKRLLMVSFVHEKAGTIGKRKGEGYNAGVFSTSFLVVSYFILISKE